MDLKQLTALITVAEVGSVSRAAELLDLVQPAVTQRIRSLEQELGIALFERTPKGMLPTEAGLVMVEHARRALDELKEARIRVRPADQAAAAGRVRVGLLESTADVVAEPLLSAMSRTYPGIELCLVTGRSGELQQWLDNGSLDLSMLYNVHTGPTLNAHPLIRERLWVVGRPDDGLRPDTAVPFALAAGRPLVMPAIGQVLRTLIDDAAAEAGVELEVAVETTSVRLQKQFVTAGHGWTVLPGVAVARDVAAGRLGAAPLSRPELHRSLVLGTARAHRTPPAVQLVAGQLMRRVKAAVADGQWIPGPG